MIHSVRLGIIMIIVTPQERCSGGVGATGFVVDEFTFFYVICSLDWSSTSKARLRIMLPSFLCVAAGPAESDVNFLYRMTLTAFLLFQLISHRV